MTRIKTLSIALALMAAACGGRQNVQCDEDSDCSLSGGGVCTLNPATSNSWCTYPDPECPSGYRWSDFGTGDGLSDKCVADDSQPPDAGVDAPDAPLPPDGAMVGDMIMIPAGPFYRGCNQAHEDCSQRTNELPLKQIMISTFYVDATEVTQAQYKQCMDASQCTAPDSASAFDPVNKGNNPVGGIEWQQAVDYCTWKGKRLPTEAEWEKASRGTDGRTYPWGNFAPDCNLAHYLDCTLGSSEPLAVGSKTGDSPYGLKDMAGNNLEWTNDYYANSYYQTSPTTDPQGPTTGMYKVIRGGGWGYGALYLRSSNRYFAAPTAKLAQFGFRCAMN